MLVQEQAKTFGDLVHDNSISEQRGKDAIVRSCGGSLHPGHSCVFPRLELPGVQRHHEERL